MKDNYANFNDLMAETKDVSTTSQKKCTLCGLVKPIEEFGKLESRCKQCRAFITRVGSKEAHEVSKKFNSEEAMAIIQEKKRAVIDKTILLDAETRMRERLKEMSVITRQDPSQGAW